VPPRQLSGLEAVGHDILDQVLIAHDFLPHRPIRPVRPAAALSTTHQLR
jgi:hypothetical protein